MNTMKREGPFRLRTAAFCLFALCVGAPAAHSATLPTSPLFLGMSVEPNVFFLLDDSGSMDWSTMASGPNGLPSVEGVTSYYAYLFPNPYRLYTYGSYSGVVGAMDITDPTKDAWRVRNYHYNGVYYNPAVTYKPWPGKDASGNPLYTDANPKAAPYDPNNPNGSTVDLEDSTTVTSGSSSYTVWPARYYTWTDSNGNGTVDNSDAHTLVNIEPSVTSYTGSASRTDCANAPTCTYAEEIQNYANWFTYYRSHLDAAKATIGTVVNDTNFGRMGLWLYNYGLLQSASSMGSASNKLSLLQTLYDHTISAHGTPARRALQKLGNYFMSSDGPILSQSQGGQCQQNFDVMVTDGYWNGSTPNPTVGDQDKDGYSNTLADVADYYYKTDLKPLLANDVPASAADSETRQHLDTFGVAFGAAGTLDPTTTDPATVTSWPQPRADQPTTVDDLFHATYDGHGKFVYAQDTGSLASALSNALASISNRSGTGAALSFNGATLTTTSTLYQVQFNSTDWTGDVLALAIDSGGNIASSATWDAQAQLDKQSASSRTILTYNDTTNAGIPFEWSDLSATEQGALETNPLGGTDSATEGQARLNYLRGDRSNEGKNGYKFRARGAVLGDIVHSSAIYVGAPGLNWPNTAPFPTASGATYTDFKTGSAKNRTPVVYVGANDGMLHGFDADTGDEVLAYVPSNLFSTTSDNGLHFLTDPAYNHRYYVDLTPSISDAYIHTSTDASGADSWHTVLVGGERGGGRGYFALDVTDPSAFKESNAANTVLWEFTNQDDPDLGYTFSHPQIALLNNGRWAAIFGSGVNVAGSANSGVGELYIVYLDGASSGSWTQCTAANKYTNCGYIKLSTGVGTTSDPDDVFTPALIDTDGNGTADRVYVGDSYGKMWVFDLSNSDPSKWASAYKQGSTPVPLFTTSTGQPITTQPQVATNPQVTGSDAGSNAPNMLVLFGTGQYIYDADKLTTNTQAFYGVWDNGKSSGLTVSNLVQQTLSDVTPTATTTGTTTVRIATSNPVDYLGSSGTAKDGWYVDLGAGVTNSPSADAGERVITDPVVRNGYVWFNSLIPAPGGCAFGGSGYLMSLDLGTGGDPGTSMFDLNGNNVVNTSDLVSYTDSNGNTQQATAVGEKFSGGLPTSPGFLANKRYTAGTNGTGITSQTIAPGVTETGRRSWEELTNN